MSTATKFNGIVDDLRSRLSYAHVEFEEVNYRGNVLEMKTNKDVFSPSLVEQLKRGLGDFGFGIDKKSKKIVLYKII